MAKYRSFRTLVVVLQGLSLSIASRHTFAQRISPTTLASAQALHDEAVMELDNENFVTACPKLERVVAMIPTGVGAMLTLAECYEGARRLASAWKTYVQVQEAAAKQGQHERSTHARKKAAEILPRLSRLTVKVSPTLAATVGLEIRLDSELLTRSVWNEAIPIDRGDHTISIKRPERKEWQKTVHIGDEASLSTVDLGEAEEVNGTLPNSTAVNDSETGGLGSQSGERGSFDRDAYWNTQRVIGVVVAGIGVAGLGVGAFWGLQAITKKSESNADGHCINGNQCDDVGYALREDSYRAGNFSTAFFVGGGIVLATGVTLFLTTPRDSRTQAAHISCSPLWASAHCSVIW